MVTIFSVSVCVSLPIHELIPYYVFGGLDVQTSTAILAGYRSGVSAVSVDLSISVLDGNSCLFRVSVVYLSVCRSVYLVAALCCLL